jgi:hypothetical protein
VDADGVDFFVSYTEADRAWASWIAWTLEEAGYRCKLSHWDVRPGNNFALEMQAAARGADRVIAVLSPAYLDARFTHPEWAAAFVQDPKAQERRLIPVMVTPSDPGGLLTGILQIRLAGLNEADARRELLSGVGAGRAKPLTTPAFPGPPTPADTPPPGLSIHAAYPHDQPSEYERGPAAGFAAVCWEQVPEPLPIRWQPTAEEGEPRSTATVQVILLPVPRTPPLTRRILLGLGDSLAAAGKSAGLFRLTQAVDIRQDPDYVSVTGGNGRDDSGLWIGATGERSGWRPLPHDPLGAILDEADAVTRITGLLRMLVRLDLPEPRRMAVAIGVAPARHVTLGHATDIGRRTTTAAGPDRDHTRYPPTQSVPYTALEQAPADIAAELARRLIVVHGGLAIQ